MLIVGHFSENLQQLVDLVDCNREYIYYYCLQHDILTGSNINFSMKNHLLWPDLTILSTSKIHYYCQSLIDFLFLKTIGGLG